MAGLGKTLIGFGILLVIAGVLLSWSDKLPWLGRLPGDIHIQREGLNLYLPLTSCVIVGILVSLVAYLFKR